MDLQKIVLNEERNVTLTAVLQGHTEEYTSMTKKRPVALVLPGGYYEYHSEREAEPVALEFAKNGYQAFVLRYSVAEHKAWPNPLNDYEQAMQLILDHAEEWNIDPDRIAVIGFSAGGHLAGCAATMAEHRPAAAIINYGVLSREGINMVQTSFPAPCEEADGTTSPCFIAATRTDSTVPASDALAFQQVLYEYSVEFESHIYGWGEHGYATGDQYINSSKVCSRTKDWMPDALSWLDDIWGKANYTGFEEPACPRVINGNQDAHYSLDCTADFMRRQKGLAKPVMDVIYKEISKMQKEYEARGADVAVALKIRTLRNIFALGNVSEKTTAMVDSVLKALTNKEAGKATLSAPKKK